MNAPDFAELSRIEEELLAARLDAIRASISHAGEKGRALEQAVKRVLRDFLPPMYGITTGFVAWLSPEGPRLSRQLDVIIYDAVRHGPLIHLETCDVLPLEAVFGYVEVKASLRSSSDEAEEIADDSIEACVIRNREVRMMTKRHYWAQQGGSPATVGVVTSDGLSIRSFLVAFEASGGTVGDLEAFAARLAVLQRRQGPPAHFHAVLIPGHGLLHTRAVNASLAKPEEYHHVAYTADHPLLTFRTLLVQSLATFDREPSAWTPALNLYFRHLPHFEALMAPEPE